MNEIIFMSKIVLCDDCDPQKVSELCKKYNMGMEIQSFYDPAYIEKNPDAIEEHINFIKDIPVRYFHAPFADLCSGSIDPLVRETALIRYKLALEITTKLNITNIIYHIGNVPNTGSVINWINRSSKLWNNFIETVPDTFNFYFENLFEKDPQIVKDFIESIDSSRMKVCLDIGHVHCYAKSDIVSWIKELGSHIGYIHVHDNNSEKDDHLGISKGTIPFNEVFQALNEYASESVWALEVNLDSMESSIDWLKEHSFI